MPNDSLKKRAGRIRSKLNPLNEDRIEPAHKAVDAADAAISNANAAAEEMARKGIEKGKGVVSKVRSSLSMIGSMFRKGEDLSAQGAGLKGNIKMWRGYGKSPKTARAYGIGGTKREDILASSGLKGTKKKRPEMSAH